MSPQKETQSNRIQSSGWASDKPDQTCIWMWMWLCMWIWIYAYGTHTLPDELPHSSENSKLNSHPRITNGWKMRAEAENPFIIFRLSVWVCVGVWVCVRGCACMTGESLAKTLDNTYVHARKTSTNKCGQVPKWEECNATHSVANGLVMQPSWKALRWLKRGVYNSSYNIYLIVYIIELLRGVHKQYINNL